MLIRVLNSGRLEVVSDIVHITSEAEWQLLDYLSSRNIRVLGMEELSYPILLRVTALVGDKEISVFHGLFTEVGWDRESYSHPQEPDAN